MQIPPTNQLTRNINILGKIHHPTLEAFLKYSFDQGICHREVAPEELFPKELNKEFKV
jgi:hypothetical protein